MYRQRLARALCAAPQLSCSLLNNPKTDGHVWLLQSHRRHASLGYALSSPARSASRATELGSIPACAVDLLAGRVIPVM